MQGKGSGEKSMLRNDAIQSSGFLRRVSHKIGGNLRIEFATFSSLSTDASHILALGEAFTESLPQFGASAGCSHERMNILYTPIR